MIPPNRPLEAHFQYGKRLHAAGRLAEAGQVYQQVLAAAPAHPDALDMMGALLLQSGRPAEALPWIERALAVKPTGSCHVHHAHTLLALGRPAAAAAAARAAIRLKRTDAQAHQVLGHALIDQGDRQGALAAYQTAARIKADLPDIQNNLGTAQYQVGQLDDALRTLTRAATQNRNDFGVLVNLSIVLRDLTRFQDAEARLAAAARLAPGDPAMLYNQGLLHLLMGRFAEGWAGWEHRFAAAAVPDRAWGKPRWRGEPLAGRTLLVHAEQGLGDTIQFCRFPFPDDGPVVFEVQPRIARLIGSRPGLRVVPAGQPLPPFDLTCPLMSLPAILGTTEAAIPAAVPYLHPEQDAVDRWRARIGAEGFRIGIVWQGNATRREDIGRSIQLTHYLPLAEIPGVRLISLQKDTGTEQLAPGVPIETLGADFDAGTDGFIDTAAAMANLDLIVTSDTAAAHLAGSLGRPVWVALKLVPDWRWMIGRVDSPWYPTMRLFRQTTRDDWRPVFAAIRGALEATIHG